MKFVTKLSVLVAISMLASGCVTQKGIDSQERIPPQSNTEQTLPEDKVEDGTLEQEGKGLVEEGDIPAQGALEQDALEQGETVSEPKEQPKRKVGVFINAKKFPSHTHVGTTKFNNFTKEYSYDWQLTSTVFNKLKTAIEHSSSFEVVDVTSKVKGAWQLDFVVKQNENWTFSENQNALRKSLLADGITRIIVIEEAPTVAITECGTYGCSEHESQGFGLFTRSFLGTDHYIASASFDISIENLDRPVDIAAQPLFKELLDDALKNERIEEFSPPKNFDEISDKELAPVKSFVVSYFDRIAATVAQYLSKQ